MNLDPVAVVALQKKILRYYSKHGRTLPWRRTTDPYCILVSEVMLQQTQVDRVIPYYDQWIARWPNVPSLASASRRDVLDAWMGLGYNSRAINLHNAAKTIVMNYAGDVLLACEDYKHVKGIGPYTSHAVRIFSTNANIATVDTNIRRILIHELRLDPEIRDRDLWYIAEQCVPRGKSRDWHNALMDYGALIKTARNTGIKPKTTQSKFEGSDRQIRAKLVRYLLKGTRAELEHLRDICEDIPRLLRILEKMKDESIIVETDGTFELHD